MTSVKVPIKVQKRSGFDKSHHNALSQPIGKIVPVLTDEIIPNTKIYCRFAVAGSMAPLASDTYMKCYYDVRAFFVPMRLLYGGFQDWFSDYEFPAVNYVGGGESNHITTQKSDIPVIMINTDATTELLECISPGSLADYLGYKVIAEELSVGLEQTIELNPLPFLAYHRICNDWYRQPNIQKEFFARPGCGVYSGLGGDESYFFAQVPYIAVQGSRRVASVSDASDGNLLLADDTSIFDLRSANYDYDYFTNALPKAQNGNPMSVNTSGGSFTIAQLRLMNSVQQFSELNAIAGSKLVDVVKARYGANLSDAVAQRSIYLGGCRIDIATGSTSVTVPNTQGANTNNPMLKQVGASAGRVRCIGTDIIVDNFTAQEPGYLMVVACVVPKVTYATGIRRYLTHFTELGSLTDMANPLLQNIGNQPIYQFELMGNLGIDTAFDVFGYTDRYAEYMSMEDECHGLFNYDGDLSSFIAQRAFNFQSDVRISDSFLQIPTDALDNISAVSSDVSKYGFFGQFAFDYKVSQPLAQYSLPSLQNPAYEHGKTIMVHRGGFRF